MAVIDAILVFGNQLQRPDEVLNAAVPAAGLPQLQFLDLHAASLGHGDVFVAAALGVVLTVEGRAQWPVALLVLVTSIAWDVLFLAFDTLPATVPVALAMLAAGSGLAIRKQPSRQRSSRRRGARGAVYS